MLTERVHKFGPDDSLLGIVTLPPRPLLEASAERPFILLLNSGIVHRVGPFGMAVRLARDLAARGYRVLRFDQTGLGDSLPSRGAPISLAKQIVMDGRAAMDFLTTRYEAPGFVVGGLCTGALNAHRICLADERVVGMWMLDGYAYPTRWYYHREVIARRIRAQVSKPISLSEVRRLATRAKEKLVELRAPPPSKAPAGEEDRRTIFYQDWPAIADARSEIEQMLARGVRALFVYTAGWSSFVDARQFDEMFPRLERRDQISVVYYPRADHTYLALEDRDAMFRDVGTFLGTVKPSSTSLLQKKVPS